MIPVRILGTSSAAPGRVVTTAELATALGRDPQTVESRTGIHTRHWCAPGTRMAEVGAEVLRGALGTAGLSAGALRRLIFVNSTGGDTLIPATANQVAAALGLSGSCDAFDLNNACMGFLSAFDIAARSIATGLGPVAIVTVEMLSRAVAADSPRSYLVLGDAAAAVVLGAAREGEGLLGSVLSNNGTLPPDTFMGHPLLTGRPERVQFFAAKEEIRRIALEALSSATQAVLEQAQVALRDIEWVLPHQPNGSMFHSVIEALGLDPARTVPVVEELGSVGAAAIPVSLDRLLRTRPVRPGDRILMAGVGAGVSRGALLYRMGS
ncbi:3-oxoacyl-[acyl-carrier-protein] synthase III C-terminal domain-containing protein [Stigmatella sp. ncwal1]|uniref:3-oxoacyl-[acyl-carrier-protein] synthase III C-terminal domain-containing protein n=1 Tax=Stigmatella ashevillensis TaxID=2995309 RepID=A0ABT5D2W3_9BACT|nr:3-oxoacyl-[acyl-carrier-protein] synthase III C-terminal domain-containing protein [Stigmatella ashevillena]MDC0708015.1 3-oxoacyl-[acyl-carrier-protein] synthase III C-terminal domain-containing protein [Stigmatella ashevillena]